MSHGVFGRYHVYMMASLSRRIYTGVTSDLPRRVFEHKHHLDPKSHSARYRITRLVYFEECPTAHAMVRREREIKGWTRAKKVALIQSVNPAWDDLAADWVLPELPPPDGDGRADPSLRSG